ncbi:hypothetical protein OOU_Y34scaffold00294g1 [Pyricularia oryzae Y34]|uniref:Uncharacterized protein n=1 Tax=Pyricularia oryzae (strain Y34) TaxID=1143189 RepID=A0AA97P3B1_PYRO3|nr:hypothetical protein OOU_Y34scaffold00294g1 [Pyricularia oryzae Y34]
MQFFTLTLALFTLRFTTAEPIPANVGLLSEAVADGPMVARVILMSASEALTPCCQVHFRGNCDCGSCPIASCSEINPDIIRNAINGATNKGPYYQVLVLPDLLALKYKPISASTLKEFDPCLALLPTYKAKSSQVPGGRDPTFGPFAAVD